MPVGSDFAAFRFESGRCTVILVARGEDGEYPYVDVGYLHLYDLFSTAAMAAMQAPGVARAGGALCACRGDAETRLRALRRRLVRAGGRER